MGERWRLRATALALVCVIAVWSSGATGSEQIVVDKLPVEGETSSRADENVEARAHANGGFWQAVLASLSVVIVSELGDKTFFIAAIMAMRHPRLIVFAGAIFALACMTVISAAFGWVATIVPRIYTYYLSALLFAIFGIKMLRDGLKMSKDEGLEELDDVQAELRRREDLEEKPDDSGESASAPTVEGGGVNVSRRRASNGVAQSVVTYDAATATTQLTKSASEGARVGTSTPIILSPSVSPPVATKLTEAGAELAESGCTDTLAGGPSPPPRARVRSRVLRVLLQAASLTFVAEWGDRSQLATVVLSAREDVRGVVLGGVLGHSLCTGLAVLGGRMVAQRISVRTVTIIGGIVFLLFAVSALFIDPDD